ncbi:fused response regulator/phosphatase [Pseudonocardia humida]|uniref:Fused response regulator/phosphatase n=1 Tax=Pseudonocardia humida TaxID=2800819 RepID=A0ABT0ZXV2_9PSEU|nr:fused response regulator/phosphatase [Pseudonocardia humida]MCO1655551.1 fused response regulator/phosphatase [Pseudonocardia humida]
MADPHPTGEGAVTVLVVDDAPATRYIVGSWLRRDGFQVVEAATGGEALALVRSLPIDLVVLDVGLPDMTGFEVCEQIKTDPALGMPVVHLSATSVEGRDRAHGLDRGADAYLTDPVEPAELVATVNSVLRYYRARTHAEELARQQTALTTATITMNRAEDADMLVAAVAVGAADMAAGFATALIAAPDQRLRQATVAAPGAAPVITSLDPAVLALLLAHFDAAPQDGPLRPVPAAVAEVLDAAAETSWALLSRSRPGQSPVCVVVHGRLAPPTRLVDGLQQLAGAAAMAADAQRVHIEEHDLALTLQRSFLPERFGTLPGLRAAVRYLPAVQHAEIGGDFYEIVQLPDGRVLVAIGDVAGHSIHAATIMLELRHALRAYAIDGHGPAQILRRLERVLRHYHRREYATLCLLLIDAAAGALSVAVAGHPPPLLVGAGEARYAPVTGPMLGVGLEHPAETVLALADVRTVVLVTDGMLEDRPTDIDAAMERLRTWPTLRADPEDVCDDLLANFGRNRADDIALLVLRLEPPV